MPKKPETKEIVISSNATMKMIVIKTPIEGVKNRTGKQAYSSVTKHVEK
tara:strand:+ start:8839 stop:8985 length:147 start_codon:yes stop_codon:yes gene_type:complete